MSRHRATRRDFMKAAGTAAATVALGSRSVLDAAPADSRPNILFMIADDWSWPHAGLYGDNIVKTPAFDRVGRQGALFSSSFCAAPTCTASRGAVLTGQAVHRLGEAANLYSTLSSKFRTYPDILEEAGYHVGLNAKGWGPGPLEGSGRTRNPAGPDYPNFREFLNTVPAGKPFCFWFGSHFPHRDYRAGSGLESGMRLEDVKVPPFLPDAPEVRSDILDYYFEVQQFDAQCAAILNNLERSGRAGNTVVVITSDNGMPFPRSKATLYESGTHMPLAIRWPGKIAAGQKISDPVSHCDFAPTFLEAAGLEAPKDMTGRSLLPLLRKDPSASREFAVTERERHANCRKGDLSYPSRALRTKEFLYIRNFRPELWPAGDPEMWKAVGDFGDIDTGPSKALLLNRRDDPDIKPFFQLATGKRPAEELYDLKADPWTTNNVASKPEYAEVREKLAARLADWMKETADPRSDNPLDDRWDKAIYHGKTTEWVFPKPK